MNRIILNEEIIKETYLCVFEGETFEIAGKFYEVSYTMFAGAYDMDVFVKEVPANPLTVLKWFR